MIHYFLKLVNTGKGIKHLSCFSHISIVQGNQIVCKKLLFIEVLYLVNEEGILKIYHYFATAFEIMDLDNGHQWLLTTQKDKQLDIICFLMEVHDTT